ncbi:MAG: replication-associated recombination protein A [Flavobacteriales bacterium]
MASPLAERMRPQSIDDIIGQEHLVGESGTLRKVVKTNNIPSIIFWGPPGVGKTTLAEVIANTLERPFYTLSAVNSGVKDVREVIDDVKGKGLFGTKNAFLFIDEIHRFSKAQQDSLLGAVENGTITLIGATTENPSFEVISPLLSRCQVYTLNALKKEHLLSIIEKANNKDELLKDRTIVLKEEEALLRLSGGDARKLLNIIELVVNNEENHEVDITDQKVIEVVQHKPALYDKEGEQHYDIISAFIKSIRGSDPNAAVYWLARMIEGGEEAKFIARRLLILASEDVGNANPTALVMANNTFQAVDAIGLPEARIILSQCAVYLACSSKSNASYEAINKAQDEINKSGDLSVPLHIRNAPTELMKELEYGKGYEYSHNYSLNFSDQEYLPDPIKGKKFYEPGANKKEEGFREFLKKRWEDKYDY